RRCGVIEDVGHKAVAVATLMLLKVIARDIGKCCQQINETDRCVIGDAPIYTTGPVYDERDAEGTVPRVGLKPSVWSGRPVSVRQPAIAPDRIAFWINVFG